MHLKFATKRCELTIFSAYVKESITQKLAWTTFEFCKIVISSHPNSRPFCVFFGKKSLLLLQSFCLSRFIAPHMFLSSSHFGDPHVFTNPHQPSDTF